MSNIKAIRNRIRSVKNTQKITKAMKLVAAAKLRRAQDAVVASRPYAKKMREIVATLSSVVDPEDQPLFEQRDGPGKVLLIPMTSDRGLCGGFNSTLIRRTNRFVAEHAKSEEELYVSPYGRKGRDAFKRTRIPSLLDMEEVLPTPDTAGVKLAVQELTARFLDEEIDSIHLVYNEFQSALTQIVRVEQFLPLTADTFADEGEAEDDVRDMIFEPPRDVLLAELIPRYLESQLYRAILESTASEMGARMTAMDNASKNAGELIEKLTLKMNRARQAAITTELMEITSGAEALKG